MMPFNSSFRKMLRSEIQEIDDTRINDYEKELAQLHQLRFGMLQPKPDNDVAETEAKLYQKIHRIWSARRQYVLEQGDLLQIPRDGKKLVRLLQASIHYRRVLYTLQPQIWAYRAWYNIKKITSAIGKLVSKLGF